MKVIQNDETVSRVQPFLLVGDGDYPANPNPRQDIGAYITATANMTLPSASTWAGVTWRIANYNLSTANIVIATTEGQNFLFGGTTLTVRPGEMYAITAIVSNDNNIKILSPVAFFSPPTAVPKNNAIPLTGSNSRLDAGFMPDISCLSYNAGTQAIAHNTLTAVTMNSESFDTSGIHSTSINTSRHTVPAGQGGLWECVASTVFSAAVSNITSVRIYKNGAVGTLIASDARPGTAGNNGTPACRAVVQMQAGDYFEMFVYQNSGGSININGWTAQPEVGTMMFSRRLA